jgi:hypothetical protein
VLRRKTKKRQAIKEKKIRLGTSKFELPSFTKYNGTDHNRSTTEWIFNTNWKVQKCIRNFIGKSEDITWHI